MCSNDCQVFWDHAAYFPVNDALKFWCDGSLACMEARKNALLSALDEGKVQYRRNDGKSYDEPVYELEARGNLLIERESFLKWAKQISSEADQQNLQKNVAINPRAEATYQNIIGALIEVMLGSSPAGNKNSVFNTQASIVDQVVVLDG